MGDSCGEEKEERRERERKSVVDKKTWVHWKGKKEKETRKGERKGKKGGNCKKVQIFVKVNVSKVIPMEVSLEDDKVEYVMRQIQKDEDAYVTLHGRVLKRSEKLKRCGVTEGCAIQVTNRLRGGGRHKVKKSKESAKTERREHREDRKDGEVEGVARDSAQPTGEGSEQRWVDEVKSDKGPAIRNATRTQ